MKPIKPIILFFYYIVVTCMLMTGMSMAMDIDIDNETCFECHGEKEISAKTRRGESLELYLSEDVYCDSRHEDLQCIQCHQPSDEEAFTVTPHRLSQAQIPDCMECHGQYFSKIAAGYHQDIHLLNGSLRCDSCHDPHRAGYLVDEIESTKPEDQISVSNSICLNCHSVDVQGVNRTINNLTQAHQSLKHAELHLKAVRCVDCHTSPSDTSNHHGLKKSETVACVNCHATQSLLVKKPYRKLPPDTGEFRFLNKGLFQDATLLERIIKAGGKIPVSSEVVHDSEEWQFTNQPLMQKFYVMGATRYKLADWLLKWALTVVAGLIFLHGLGRILTALKYHRQRQPVEDLYLYSIGVRIWHWTNALLMILLITTGCSIHFSDTGAGWLKFGTAVKIHEISGGLLILSYVFFLLDNIINANIKNYLPRVKGGLTLLLAQLKYYCFGIFIGGAYPFHPQKSRKFNPMQKIAYITVMFLVLPIIMASGVMLLIPEAIPVEISGQNGIWGVAMIHYAMAGLCILFLLVHLYLITTGERLTFLIRGMLTGYHRSFKHDKG